MTHKYVAEDWLVCEASSKRRASLSKVNSGYHVRDAGKEGISITHPSFAGSFTIEIPVEVLRTILQLHDDYEETKDQEPRRSFVYHAEPSSNREGEIGWNLNHSKGTIWLTAKNCQVTPNPEEECLLEGRGFGFPVTGIVIGGRRYR